MTAHNRIVIEGSIYDGAEVWSTGVAFGGTGVLTNQVFLESWVSNILQALGNQWATSFGGLQALISNEVTIDAVTAYYYPGPGPAAALASEASGGTLNGDTDSRLPSYTAMCISLRTGINTASGRGRMYLPALGAQLTATGRFGGVSGPSAVGADMVALLALIQQAHGEGDTLYPGVYSATQDAFNPLNSLRVGDVPDTQRRRKDALAEAYTTLQYPV